MTDAREATKDGKDASSENMDIEEKEPKFAFNGKVQNLYSKFVL